MTKNQESAVGQTPLIQEVVNLKKYRISQFIILILITSFFSQPLHAEEQYISIGTGVSDIVLNGIPRRNNTYIYELGGTKKIVAGSEITKNFSVETFYAEAVDSKKYKVGEVGGATGDIANFFNDLIGFGLFDTNLYAYADISVSYFGVNAIYTTEFTPTLTFFIKGGFSKWELDLETLMPDSSIIVYNNDGTGKNFGIGMKRNYGDSWAVVYEFERYDFDIAVNKVLFGINVEFSF